MSKRNKVILATTALLIATIGVASAAAFLMNRTPTKSPENGFWTLVISPSDPNFSSGHVEPNGTIQVPTNQTGIEVTATPTGINGFIHWRFDGEIVDSNSTIFVPKQAENSNHTLEAVFAIGTPTMIPSATPSSSGQKQGIDVLAIGKKYVEETYGTDYALNGDVSQTTFSNGTGTWTYPSASFRIPSDWQKPGTLVTVMVNPETGQIFNVLTYWSKSMPPPIPTPLEETSPHYLPYPNGNESRIFLVSATSTYGVYLFESIPYMGSNSGVQKGDACFIINVTLRNDYTDQNPLPGLDLSGRNSTHATIFLTAQLFNTQGAVKATDVTPPYPGIPYGGAYLSLDSKEIVNATIYLATNHTDIDHYEIVPEYIGAIPPP